MSRASAGNVTSVGGLVVRGDTLLLVRMTYGPNNGRYMLPGGLLDPGETLDTAVVREVLEETGVTARPVGIVGLRSRFDGERTDNYILWLLEHVAGEPRAEGHENDDARYLTLTEMDARDDISAFAHYLAQHVLSGRVTPLRLVEDYDQRLPGSTPDSWKLFL